MQVPLTGVTIWIIIREIGIIGREGIAAMKVQGNTQEDKKKQGEETTINTKTSDEAAFEIIPLLD
ncbi:MAG: hypothetical protein NTV58_06200 [Deltaproteobacteria bacterium]|nr:hypothetical protein [Deltaproteobacteria bacterium]